MTVLHEATLEDVILECLWYMCNGSSRHCKHSVVLPLLALVISISIKSIWLMKFEGLLDKTRDGIKFMKFHQSIWQHFETGKLSRQDERWYEIYTLFQNVCRMLYCKHLHNEVNYLLGVAMQCSATVTMSLPF
jgi:hypothetical protein